VGQSVNFTASDEGLEVWQPAGLSVRIEYDRAVLGELGTAATEGFNRLNHGGIEIGGVLFGRREPDGLKVTAYRELACEHAFGPSFTLSESDCRALQVLLDTSKNDPELLELQAVGWYVSHTRSELLLSEKDLRLFERFFPEAWQIALVLRPNRFDPVRAGFFFRETDGSVHASASRHEFIIQQPVTTISDAIISDDTHSLLKPSAPPAPDKSASAEIAILELAVLPAETPLPRIATPRRGRWRAFWLSAGAAAITLALAGSWLWFPKSRILPGLSLHTFDTAGQLRIDWNCPPEIVQRSEYGALEIEDGPDKVLNVLSRDQLRAGSLTYARISGNVLVRLRVRATDQRMLTQTARFLGPPVPAAAPVSAGVADRSGSRTEGPRQEPEPSAKELPERIEFEPAGAEPLISLPPRRQLRVPATTVQQGPDITLGAPPSIATNNTLAILPEVPTLPDPLLPAVPKALAPALKRVEHIPQSGKMIWTGKVARRGTITILGNHASPGQITGGLPGGPVRVQIFPAELTQDGLRIFATDPKWVQDPEAPGAQNGWNQTTYVLNSKQARDITVVEAPANENGWNRLVLRAERGVHTIIVLRWERF
jgi:proteasome lid subunit RPN8/RPN11